MKVFFGVTSGIVSFSQLTLKFLGNTDVNFGREVDTAKDSGERSSGLLLARHFRRKLMGVRGKKRRQFSANVAHWHTWGTHGGVWPLVSTQLADSFPGTRKRRLLDSRPRKAIWEL